MARRGRGTKRTNKNINKEEPPPKLKKEESFNTKLKNAIEDAKAQCSKKPKTYKPDYILLRETGPATKVHEDFACMLNQSNVCANNNKYYVIQVAKEKKKFITFTRWGRVGEDGMFNIDRFSSADDAIGAFKKKFKDKTKNNWENRANFKAASGKYTMLELDEESGDEDEPDSGKGIQLSNQSPAFVKSNLDSRTLLLIRLIFNNDMFTNQMASMHLDIRKMPLGKLSKLQIAKGLETLIELEEAVKANKNRTALAELTSKFYTLIPHDFGRMTPPIIDNEAIISQKKEVMMTLSDIELTQSLQKKNDDKKEAINPMDEKYEKLECQLELLDQKSKEFDIIKKYVAVTDQNRKILLDVWKVDRKNEGTRFNAHKKISHRKLLWHGTNVAVVAAILKAGLRIMPHSGGRVGRGIYFASEHSKSAGYVGYHYGMFENEKNVGFMFLTEVALGNVNTIYQDNCSLKAPPKGYDSVVAQGTSEPDPKKDIEMEIDNNTVIVPIGKPKTNSKITSSFWQSEYLVYKESQARIRYLLKFSF